MQRTRASMREIVARSKLFRDLSEEQLDRVAELCREEMYTAGQTIFAEGNTPKDLYIVERGRVALDANFSARPGSWKRGTVDVITENQSLGWSALTHASALTLSARAIEDTKLLAIDGVALRALLEQDTAMGYAVMQEVVVVASSRMQSTKETLSRILSVASHDLRAPLNAVQTYATVLTGGFFGEMTDRQKEVLTRCSERLTELSHLIDNILDLTRFEEGYLPKEALCLSDLVQDAVEMLQPMAARRDISLRLGVPPDPVNVEGSPARLKQVMSNLLGNAIKFTSAGGEVQVRLTSEASQIRVEVADTGVGICPQDLPRIFDEFYQGQVAEASDGRETDTRGVGLGLSICQKIIQAHQGRIWAESPCPGTGKGSLFTFTLPRTTANDAGGPAPKASRQEGASDAD